MKTKSICLIILFILFILSFNISASENKDLLSDEDKMLIEDIESEYESKPLEDDLFSEDDFAEYNTKNEDLQIKAANKVFDPFEPVNRGIFYFNDKVYAYIFSPISKGYKKVTPRFARIGINNFFSNLAAPIRIVNNLLQGKVKNAAAETGGFFVNTLLGFLGFVDSAQVFDSLKIDDNEDFGQTLGRWGIGAGPYIVLPIIGPSNLRDIAGKVGDFYAWNPIGYVKEHDQNLGNSMWMTEQLNNLPQQIEMYDTLKSSAFDPYTAARDGYRQLRDAKIKK